MKRQTTFNISACMFMCLIVLVCIICISCKGNVLDDNPPEIMEVQGSVGISNIENNDWKIQSYTESKKLTSQKFSIKVPSDTTLQLLAVTDSEDRIYMLYRANLIQDNQIIIDAYSTALALTTFHPLFAPISVDDYPVIVEIITQSQYFESLQNAIAQSIEEKSPIYSQQGVTDALETLLNSICDTISVASSNTSMIHKSVSQENIDCYPIHLNSHGNTVEMKLSGLRPSYYGTVTTPSGSVENIHVTTRDDYGFLDLFKAVGEVNYGEPTYYSLNSDGHYDFFLSRVNREATFDFYLRLANNILDALGFKLPQTLVTGLSVRLQTALSIVSGTNPSPMFIMRVCYDTTIDFMQSELFNNKKLANYHIAGRALKQLGAVYNGVKGSTNLVFRIAYAFADLFGESEEGLPEEVSFCLNYKQSINDIVPCDDEIDCLMELFEKTKGNNWTNNTNWGSSAPLSEWHGLTTDDNGHVTSINLSRNNIDISYVTLDLSCLTKLKSVNLSNNILQHVTINHMGKVANITLQNCVRGRIYINGFKNITIDGYKTAIFSVECDCQKLMVSNCDFGDEYCPFSSAKADSTIIDNCTMHSCGSYSSYLNFRNHSRTYDTWYCVTSRKLIISNSYCSTICSWDFNDNTVIVLQNATLWRSNWDDESLVTITRTITGAQWNSLFQE